MSKGISSYSASQKEAVIKRRLQVRGEKGLGCWAAWDFENKTSAPKKKTKK